MPEHVNRTNFVNFWLEYEKFHDNSSFIECILSEKPDSRELIKKPLNQAILDHHFYPNTIKRHLENLDFKTLAEELPTGNTRKGNFGEVVASEHLCQSFNYKMPVYKLRYRDGPMSMRGEDVVAFKMEENSITAVCVGEAKFIDEFKPSTVINAHEKLEKTYIVRPYTLSQIRNILEGMGNSELALQVDYVIGKLGSRDFPRENWIFVISGDKPIDPFSSLRDTVAVENLYVFSLYLENLQEFSEEVHDFSEEVYEL